MRTIEEIETFLEEALRDDARDRLVDTGDAWSMMRRNGVNVPDGPPFRATMDADLAEYGFAVLDSGLALRSIDRGRPLAKDAFFRAGRVFEALVRNGDPEDSRRGFHRVIAATAYHLGGYAAVAFALFAPISPETQNLNEAEAALIKLLLRDLDGVRDIARSRLVRPDLQDATLAKLLLDEEAERDDVLAMHLISSVCRALATFEFALRTGEGAHIDDVDRMLTAAYGIAGKTGHVSLWWVIRVTRHLLSDLWGQSLHEVIPSVPTAGEAAKYALNRTRFIAALFRKNVSQVELWPSQIEAARRAADPSDDLVVALPTSAGKTRIAELAALTTLSMNKRVLIVTPLRALSAQTERNFRAAFAPLGATVSSLYGKSGLSAGDENALRSDDIVVSTPEKLDFALRSDPTVIDDVGLIVLDEGHMIGPDEREVRYEILVQRLLKRADAESRRIVCLSAILPRGDELDDMTAWIRSDAEGQPVRSEWRPTRQRFGTLEWRGQTATLHYDLDNNGPFLAPFIEARDPIRPERIGRPRDTRDVSLMAAWRFAEEGKRTLIYVTQANWVEGYAKQAIELVRKGYLQSLLQDESAIQDAVTIGTEWLGANHPAVACLGVGIAVHHGKLPSPFLREVERLLASGVIRVTAASPTLAQGLNLNAAVLLAPYLVRSGDKISAEEFANVAGRAGRAFVDTEGLILHVMKDKFASRLDDWRKLVTGVKERTLKSGLRIVIDQVVKRLVARGVEKTDEAYEYLANAREDWLLEPEDTDGEPIEDLVAKLDAIIFGLIEALDSDANNLPELLDEALRGSLWDRQMRHLNPGVRRMQMKVLKSRARLIWNTTTPAQRVGHFVMGVGLETGLKIDLLADALGAELDRADLAALRGDLDTLHEALTVLCKNLLSIGPFVPNPANALRIGWENILRLWLAGTPIADIGSDCIGIVEDAFVYRLVWAMEALRTRRMASGWTPEEGIIPGAAAACLDTGLPNYRMSLFVRSGLASREAAIRIVDECDPMIFDGSGLRNWLRRGEVADLTAKDDWPTPTTVSLWRRFREDMIKGRDQAWSVTSHEARVALSPSTFPVDRTCRVEADDKGGTPWVLTPDYTPLGRLEETFDIEKGAIYFAKLSTGESEAVIHRIGPM